VFGTSCYEPTARLEWKVIRTSLFLEVYIQITETNFYNKSVSTSDINYLSEVSKRSNPWISYFLNLSIKLNNNFCRNRVFL